MRQLIESLPKAELHLHIEGTLEPELMFELAERNDITLPFASIEEVKAGYEFTDLQSFLDIYDHASHVLQTEQDFYDLTWAYLKRCEADRVVHTEIFFDAQTHTHRGIAFETVVNGIHRALKDGEKQLGITSRLILSILRHESPEAAVETVKTGLQHKDKIHGLGMSSTEKNNPPGKYKAAYDLARDNGWFLVGHAGEEGPPAYIWEALKTLSIERIDHGVRAEEDPELVDYLREKQVPLTVCPLSNVKLCVFKTLAEHNLKRLLNAGLMVTINSDDPSFFGGYVNQNYIETAEALKLTEAEIRQLAKNSILASKLSQEQKSDWLSKID